MGLFVNNEKHPDVFKSNVGIIEPNQTTFKKDPLSDFIKVQQAANDSLQRSLHELEKSSKQRERRQTSQWKQVGNKLNQLQVMNQEHENRERHFLEELKKLEEQNKKIQVDLESERVEKRNFVNQINSVSQSNQELVNQIERYGTASEGLALKMEEQVELQKQMANQITKQENTQSEIVKRLDDQEALTEKMIRQLNNFRSILFERTNYLSEKIENGYHRTSSYLYKVMKNSDHSLEKVKVHETRKKDDQ